MIPYVKIPNCFLDRAWILGAVALLFFMGRGNDALGVDLDISRSVEHTGERQYLVTVEVSKEGLSGYAKLEESIPQGFVAHKAETKGANYIFKDGEAKLIWMDLPSESSFEVSYKLIQKQSEPGEFTIKGRFSCVSGDDLVRVEGSSSFEVEGPDPIASSSGGGAEDEPSMEENESDEEDLAAKEEEDEDDNDRVEEEETDNGAKKDTGSEERVAEKEGDEGSSDLKSDDRFFSVQIGAFSKKKPRSYFTDRYGVTDEKINHYREGELHKYSIGRYRDYDEANDAKERFRSEGGGGAFVIGFQGGDAVKASALLE